jgi:hypothetical protein
VLTAAKLDVAAQPYLLDLSPIVKNHLLRNCKRYRVDDIHACNYCAREMYDEFRAFFFSVKGVMSICDI